MANSNEMTGDADIVLLAVAQSEMEGMMWADAVRTAGIQVLVKSGGPGMGAWASAATFEHRLYVRQDQLELARDVLAGATGRRGSAVRARRDAPRTNPRLRHKSG